MTFKLSKRKRQRRIKAKLKKSISKKGGSLKELFTTVSTAAGSCTSTNSSTCSSTNKISQIRQQQQSDSQYDTNSQTVSAAADNINQTTQCQSDTNYSNQQFEQSQKNYCDVMSKSTGTRCGGGKKKH